MYHNKKDFSGDPSHSTGSSYFKMMMMMSEKKEKNRSKVNTSVMKDLSCTTASKVVSRDLSTAS